MNYYNYYTEIEDEFIKRRGTHILISPLDWSLIETWRQTGIPLSIVLRGINASFESFDRLPKHGRKVNSLVYCQQEVEALYHQYREGQVGSNPDEAPADESGQSRGSGFEVEAVVNYLSERCELLRARAENRHETQLMTETFARAVNRLEELIGNLTSRRMIPDQRLESALLRIEELLLEGIEASFSQTDLKRMRRQAEKELKRYREGMGDEVYQLTLRNYLAKQWREQFKVPRLSLFYM
jgi:hypothetical protein